MLTATLILLALPQDAVDGAKVKQEPAPKTAWELLVTKYDADHDGKITRAEYSKEDKYFLRLDRDEDGVLTEADAKLLGGRPKRSGQRGKPAPKPKVEAAKIVVAKAGEVAPDFELVALQPAKKAGTSKYSGGTKKAAPGKAVSKIKPKKVKLSSFTGKKPVALIFGSYT